MVGVRHPYNSEKDTVVPWNVEPVVPDKKSFNIKAELHFIDEIRPKGSMGYRYRVYHEQNHIPFFTQFDIEAYNKTRVLRMARMMTYLSSDRKDSSHEVTRRVNKNITAILTLLKDTASANVTISDSLITIFLKESNVDPVDFDLILRTVPLNDEIQTVLFPKAQASGDHLTMIAIKHFRGSLFENVMGGRIWEQLQHFTKGSDLFSGLLVTSDEKIIYNRERKAAVQAEHDREMDEYKAQQALGEDKFPKALKDGAAQVQAVGQGVYDVGVVTVETAKNVGIFVKDVGVAAGSATSSFIGYLPIAVLGTAGFIAVAWAT